MFNKIPIDFCQDIFIMVAHKHKPKYERMMFYHDEIPTNVTLLPVIPVQGKINPTPKEIQEYFQSQNARKATEPKEGEDHRFVPPYAVPHVEKKEKKKKRFSFRKRDWVSPYETYQPPGFSTVVFFVKK